MAQIAMVVGAAVMAYGQYEQGEAAKDAGDMAAQQHEMNAKSSLAEGIRASHEIRRQKKVVKSDAVAAMVAGGGVSDDVGAIKTLSDIEQVYDYNSLAALFAGETQADAQQYAARVAKYDGKSFQSASRLSAISTMISGVSSAYSMGHTADPSVSGYATTGNIKRGP